MAYPSSFHPRCLAGRVALITGGGSGIGMGTARVFLSYGAHVAILSRNLKKLQAAAEELEKATGGRCLAVQADVRSVSEVEAAVDRILETFGHIDILINNAAGNFLASLEKLSLKGFKTVMEIDTLGVFVVSKTVFHKAFQRDLKKHLPQTDKGSESQRAEPTNQDAATARACSPGKVIINMSMTLHYAACLLQSHAGAAKAAIDALTKHMAVEWGPYNVRVNGIAPGPIAGTVGFGRMYLKASENPTSGTIAHSETKKADRADDPLGMMTRYVPLQRIGHVQDVAFACLFLSLPEASYITGTTLVVDGGQWMTTGNFTCLEPTINEKWRNAPFAANL